jgi:hypothetical protein
MGGRLCNSLGQTGASCCRKWLAPNRLQRMPRSPRKTPVRYRPREFASMYPIRPFSGVDTAFGIIIFRGRNIIWGLPFGIIIIVVVNIG